MKKLLVALSLLLPLASVADDFDANIPQWKDFVPTAYVDVKEPKGLGKLNVIASYWYQRRVDFETELVNCKALDTINERFSCFEDLKVKQYKENTDYNARMEARQQNSGIQEMNNMQNTMFPLNNYLQNIGRFQANEFH